MVPKLNHPHEICRLQNFHKVWSQLRHYEECRLLGHRVKQLWTEHYEEIHLSRK